MLSCPMCTVVKDDFSSPILCLTIVRLQSVKRNCSQACRRVCPQIPDVRRDGDGGLGSLSSSHFFTLNRG